jgi:hypothetical protein
MPQAEFDIFRDAARAWLATAPSLDPPLAAAVDVLALAHSEHQLRRLAVDAADAHTALGARAVLDLRQAVSSEDLAEVS